MKSPKARTVLLWGTLALSIWLSVQMESGIHTESVVSAAERRSSLQARGDFRSDDTAGTPPAVALDRSPREPWTENAADPFRTKAWYVAPPPPPPPAPPKPIAPALPFTYMGAIEDTDLDGKVRVFLARGDDSFQVAVGERFAEHYELEKIERGQLIFRYLPLSILQTLPTGWTE